MGGMKKGGPAKMAMGGTYNEKGKRATLAEMEAEDRRMGSSMPAKKAKPVGPSSVAVSKVLDGMAKKAVKKNMGGGVNSKLSSMITQTKANMAAGPRAKSTFVDTMKKAGPQKPSSGNPLGDMLTMIKSAVKPSSGNLLMGGPDKPQVSGGPVTDPRANIGNTLEIMKKQGSARELPTPPMIKKPKSSSFNPLTGFNTKSKGTELPSTTGSLEKPTLWDEPPPPTRGPSMSPAFNDRPMIRRKTGGLSVMPKGKR